MTTSENQRLSKSAATTVSSLNSSEQSVSSITNSSGRLTLSGLLRNSFPAPFTLDSFRKYLQHQHCEELLDFVVDLNTWRKNSGLITTCNVASGEGNVSVSTDSITCRSEQSLEMAMKIVDSYIRVPSDKELSLPSKVRTSCITGICNDNPKTAKDIDQLFKSVESAVLEVLRTEKFSGWIKENQGKK